MALTLDMSSVIGHQWQGKQEEMEATLNLKEPSLQK